MNAMSIGLSPYWSMSARRAASNATVSAEPPDAELFARARLRSPSHAVRASVVDAPTSESWWVPSVSPSRIAFSSASTNACTSLRCTYGRIASAESASRLLENSTRPPKISASNVAAPVPGVDTVTFVAVSPVGSATR